MVYRLARRVLFALPPEVSHGVTLTALKAAHALGLVRPFVNVAADPVTLMGLRFPNRIGLAAGLDKNGRYLDALGALGVGFIEVGTVTLCPQPGNARPRLFRLVEDHALINRMGFPNDGVQKVCERVRASGFKGIRGINIGKNAATPFANAIDDYVACLRVAYGTADYIAINISSPNTQDLRELQQKDHLRQLLGALTLSRRQIQDSNGRYVPMLVKLTADLTDDDLVAAARLTADHGLDGVIATNTTTTRTNLRAANASEQGGLSGAPLIARSLHAIALLRSEVGANLTLIGAGGVMEARDAVEMRRAGADLIQIYTGLVYRGPRFIHELVSALTF